VPGVVPRYRLTMRAVLALLVVVAGALGGFAIYTWGWHNTPPDHAALVKAEETARSVALLNARVSTRLALVERKQRSTSTALHYLCYSAAHAEISPHNGQPGAVSIVKVLKAACRAARLP
jgi:apolipoprotein N-acyltransferase